MFKKLDAFISGRRFFILILTLFIFSASWITLSGRYPMPFDEQTHVGTIQYYADHPNPFANTQPPETYQYGLIAHDPSYLYHYLLSFPWRLITALTSNFMTQVIVLRAINIALFAFAIVLFRKVLRRAKLSERITNISIFLFVLTPLVPQVAAQINYDNVFILILAACLLLTQVVTQKLKSSSWDITRLGLLSGLVLLGTLFKFTFLPMAAAIFGYLAWQIIKTKKKNNKLFASFKPQLAKMPKLKLWALIIFVLLSLGLFVQRYGYNIVRYSSLNPACRQVISEEACLKNTVIQRNHDFLADKPTTFKLNPFEYLLYWFNHMGFNLMFALNGPYSAYFIGRPLVFPELTAIVFGTAGLVLSVYFWRKIWANSALRFLILIIFAYGLSLLVNNYLNFLKYDFPVAVQGRYLIPILIPVYAIFALAFKNLFKSKVQIGKLAMWVALLGFIYGGGVFTYIVRSDEGWYWQKPYVNKINKDPQKILRTLIIYDDDNRPKL